MAKEAKVKQAKVEDPNKIKPARFSYIKRYWQLYALLLLPMIYLLVFKYGPMYYVLIAFKKYSIVQSV